MAIRLLFLLILSSVLAACVSETPQSTPNTMHQSSAISMATPAFITSQSTTLRWYSELIWVDDQQGQYQRRADMLQLALQNEFIDKGYTFANANEDANYDVIALALLGDIEGHEALENAFRLYPSLAGTAGERSKGTVLVALAPAGTNTIVWRGALQIFTDPSMRPIEARKQRMEWGAKQVLSSIPNYP